jgi:hypothetical protein
MYKLLLAVALASLSLGAATTTQGKPECCKAKTACCSEKCCKAEDHCCKDMVRKACVKACPEEPKGK